MTDYQVRYLATVRCVAPSAHAPTTSGDSALYAPEDVALIRLILRLVGEGAPYWMARAAVAQHADALRAAFAGGADGVFGAAGPVGELSQVAWPTTTGPVWKVRLSDVRRGLLREIRAERLGTRVWARWGARTTTEAMELISATA